MKTAFIRNKIKDSVIQGHKYAPAIYGISFKNKKHQPFICIVTPIFDPALDSLKLLINDLKKQSFGHFLHVVVSNGNSGKVRSYMDRISKNDPRFIYEQTTYRRTLTFESILSNSGQRRDYILKKYEAEWFHFLDSDVRITDNDYFAKLFMGQYFNKTDILLVKTLYHGTVYPLDPISKEGHITISNYIFSNQVAKSQNYPTEYKKGDLPSDFRYWVKISKNHKVTLLDILGTSEGDYRSYKRMTDKKIEGLLGGEMISVFGNNFSGDLGDRLDSLFSTHLVGHGSKVVEFENLFKKKIGIKNAVATNSCTNAFWVLLKSLNFKPDDEIIIPSTHFFGVVNVLKLLNIKYRVVDVDADTPNMDIDATAKAINKNTRAIICLDFGGYPFDITALKKKVRKVTSNKITFILDAANSPFTKNNGNYTALSYDYSIYSFDMNKVLVTGEGGMILSNKNLDAARANSYYGIKDKSTTGFAKSKQKSRWWEISETEPSLKLAMNNIAAVIGLSQLEAIGSNLKKRESILKLYHKKLSYLKKEGFIDFPVNRLAKNTTYLFWVRLDNEKLRDGLANFLIKKNVYTTVKYQPLSDRRLTPNAWKFFETSLCLPINQNMNELTVDYIVSQILDFYHGQEK